MPFNDVLLADIELDKSGVQIPLGTYVFSLAPGSAYRPNKFSGVEELNVRFIVAEGDHQGKGIFQSYPDPTAVSKNGKSMAKFAQALKKLEIAIGIDAMPGEDTAAYLNRVATTGARVTADVVKDRFIKEGETEPKAVFGIWTVRPAA